MVQEYTRKEIIDIFKKSIAGLYLTGLTRCMLAIEDGREYNTPSTEVNSINTCDYDAMTGLPNEEFLNHMSDPETTIVYFSEKDILNDDLALNGTDIELASPYNPDCVGYLTLYATAMTKVGFNQYGNNYCALGTRAKIIVPSEDGYIDTPEDIYEQLFRSAPAEFMVEKIKESNPFGKLGYIGAVIYMGFNATIVQEAFDDNRSNRSDYVQKLIDTGKLNDTIIKLGYRIGTGTGATVPSDDSSFLRCNNRK